MTRRGTILPVVLLLAAAAVTWWIARAAFRDADPAPEAGPAAEAGDRAVPSAAAGPPASGDPEAAARNATRPVRPIGAGPPGADASERPAPDFPTGSALVSLRVLDAVTRAPVRGAEVVVDEWMYRLAEDARVRLPFDPPLLVNLEVRAPRYCPAAFRVVDESMGESGEAPPTLELLLQPAARLEGTVRSADGKPEPEATLHVWANVRRVESPEPTAGSAFVVRRTRRTWDKTTEPDGTFCFAVLPAGRPLTVYGRVGRSRHLRNRAPFVLRAGETRRIDLVALPTGSVRGRVVDHLGRPVVGARIDATVRRGFAELGFGRSRARSDKQGRFRIENVPAGKGTLVAHPSSAAEETPDDFARETVTFAITRQHEVVSRTIVVHPGLAIRGRVISPDGTPLDGVRVERRGAAPSGYRRQREIRARTDATGAFVLAPLARGEHRLVARGFDGFGDSAPTGAKAGADDVVLKLTHACSIEGVVRDGAAGSPARGRVRLWPRADGEPDRTVDTDRTADTDREGRFRFERVPAGEYDLSATAWSGMRVGVRRGVRVVKRQSVRDVVIALYEGGVIRLDGPDALVVEGLVVESGGRVVHREASVRPADLPAIIVPTGRVRVRGSLVADGKEKREPLDRTSEVAAGETVTLELSLVRHP